MKAIPFLPMPTFLMIVLDREKGMNIIEMQSNRERSERK